MWDARAEAPAPADAGVYRGIRALLAANTGIQFGEEVEQVLEGRSALRQVLVCRPEVRAQRR